MWANIPVAKLSTPRLMDRPGHTCGLNFYCYGCYNLGYGQAIMDSKPSTSGIDQESIEKMLYEYCNTHGYNLMAKEARQKLAHTIAERLR